MILIIDRKHLLKWKELEENSFISLNKKLEGVINGELCMMCNLVAFELWDGLYYALKKLNLFFNTVCLCLKPTFYVPTYK